MITLDMMGFSCPEPALKAKKAIEQYKDSKEEIVVIVDNNASKDNVLRIGQKNGYKTNTSEKDSDYYITLSL